MSDNPKVVAFEIENRIDDSINGPRNVRYRTMDQMCLYSVVIEILAIDISAP